MSTDDVRILIVDDEPRNLDALEAMLETCGCTLVRAQSADEALLAMLRHEFAAMILDIKMPGMSGIELANLVKQRRRTQDVPILFLTAHLMEDEDVLRGYGVGAVDYLSKPIKPDILRSKVMVFIDLYRKTRALAALNQELQNEVSARQKAQQALEQINQELERRVSERTAALTVARDEAERQSRIKDEFLATLSHELRTPMNAILGWLCILAKHEGRTSREQALAIIQRNAEAQAKLIDDLLEMNRLSSGILRLEVGQVDLGSILRGAIESLRPAADSKGIRLHVAIPSGLPVIPADPNRVQQIVWNLLHNAVKFTHQGGRVDVSVTCADATARIQVKDTGQGISADFLPYVFDRFRQADSSTTRGAWGLGLGLSIAKHLVELHGGSIDAASEGIDAGATFTVRLPLLHRADAADQRPAPGETSVLGEPPGRFSVS
jgi:signal transduction histidine kinase